jgi:hypothetical protein
MNYKEYTINLLQKPGILSYRDKELIKSYYKYWNTESLEGKLQKLIRINPNKVEFAEIEVIRKLLVERYIKNDK